MYTNLKKFNSKNKMDEFDLELLSETPDCNMKEIELKEGNNKYKCKIELKNKYLKISVYNNIIKYEGKINISNIEYNLGIFNCSISEIFDEIYTLDNNKFNLIKDNDLNKYILKIEFSIFKKKRYLNVDLYKQINNNDNIDYINKIKDLEEKIKEKDNTIKLLEEELNKYKCQECIENITDDEKYLFYNEGKKENINEIRTKVEYHEHPLIYCMTSKSREKEKWKCNKCEEKYDMDIWGFYCSLCDFSLCYKCYDKSIKK